MRYFLVVSILFFGYSALAEPVLPSAENATSQAAIPHPRVDIPQKGEVLAGIRQGGKGATNVGWLYPLEPHKGFDAVRVTVSPRLAARGDQNFIYWAFDSVFMDNETWYVGLQPNGEFGKTALFSVFGKGSYPKSAACKSGADGGAGTHCHIHYEWQLGHSYEFTVALVAANAELSTWEGAIFDLTSGERTLIGDIDVPSARGYLKAEAMTFSEYFHRTTKCPDQPASEVLFLRPVGYRNGKEYLGKVHSLNANSGCNPSFYSDNDGFAYVDVGTVKN